MKRLFDRSLNNNDGHRPDASWSRRLRRVKANKGSPGADGMTVDGVWPPGWSPVADSDGVPVTVLAGSWLFAMSVEARSARSSMTE